MLPDPIGPLPCTRHPLRELMLAYARRRPVKRVVVVGNAPMPPSASRAALIDSADLVVRITSLAVDQPGAEPGYGTATDVVFLHRGTLASPWLFQGYRNRLYLLVEPGRLHWEQERLPDWWPSDLGYVPIGNREWTVPLCDLAGIDLHDTASWPTTGTLAIYVVTDLLGAADVQVTGVSIVDDAAQSSFAHAWGLPVPITAEHRLDREQDLLRSWVRAGRIAILR